MYFSELYVSMKDPDRGIREIKLEKDKKVFNHCFTGKIQKHRICHLYCLEQ